jgi:hypothetical protein
MPSGNTGDHYRCARLKKRKRLESESQRERERMPQIVGFYLIDGMMAFDVAFDNSLFSSPTLCARVVHFKGDGHTTTL